MSTNDASRERMIRLEEALLSRNDSLFIQVLTELKRLMDAGDNKGAHIKFTAKQKIQAGAIIAWATLNDFYGFFLMKSSVYWLWAESRSGSSTVRTS